MARNRIEEQAELGGSTPLTLWQKFLIVVDASFAFTDIVFDCIMIHEFFLSGDKVYAYIGIFFVVAPVLVTKFNFFCGPVGGCVQTTDDDLRNTDDQAFLFFVEFVPGFNMLVYALYIISILPRGKFKTRATKMEQAFNQTRAFEAFLEAHPQIIFQVITALKAVEGISYPILMTSFLLSLISLTKTMVSFFIFQDFYVFETRDPQGGFGRYQRKISNSFPNKTVEIQMLVLSFVYELAEVLSHVLSVALLGYFCGWYSIISFVIQYILLYIYLRAQDLHYSLLGENNIRKGYWRYLLIPILGSFVAGNAIPFKWYLLLRLFITGSYTAVIIVMNWGNLNDLTFLTIVLGWITIGATILWSILMPSFVNSCHNLGVAFYSWTEERYEPERFTSCFCLFEIRSYNTESCSELDEPDRSSQDKIILKL